MIRVTYWRNLHRVVVDGHANSGEYGKDLVCAAASALALTLAENVRILEKNGQVRNTVTVLKDGRAEIACEPYRRCKSVTTLILDSVCAGYDVLSREYPDYILFEISGALG